MKNFKLYLSLLMLVCFSVGTFAAEYELVSSASDLEAGANYVIGSAASESGVFMSTENRSNNRGATGSITITDGKVTGTDAMLVLTLGGSTGAWTFLTQNYSSTNGYLGCATTSANQCKVNASVSDHCKFTIEFSGSAAVIKSTGRTDRNLMRYNSGNNPPIFACYTSGQNDIYLYKEVGSSSEDKVAMPTFNPEAGLYTSAQNVVLSCTTADATIYYTLDGTEPSTSSSVYSSPISVSSLTTIKAVAVKAGMTNSSIATAVYAVVAHAGTETDPYTVADARAAVAANMGVTNVYVTGIVSKIVTPFSSEFGNITYNISADGLATSDSIQAYRGMSYSGAKFTSENDILVGDEVVVVGNLTDYKGTYEFAQGNQLVSLRRGDMPIMTVSPKTIDFGTVYQGSTVEAKEVTVTFSNIKGSPAYSINSPFSGSGTIAASGDKITINADASNLGEFSETMQIVSVRDGLTEEVTVTMKVIEAPVAHTVSFNTGAGNGTVDAMTEAVAGEGITLPAGPTDICASGWTFAGWAAASVDVETMVKPALLAPGANYKPTANVTLYAVYKRSESESGAGTGFKLAIETETAIYYVGAKGTGNYLLAVEGSDNAVVFEYKDGYLSFDDSGTKTYISSEGNNTTLTVGIDQPTATWTETEATTVSYQTSAEGNRYLGLNAGANPKRFAPYASSYPHEFVKESLGTTYYLSALTCCTGHEIKIADAVKSLVKADKSSACKGDIVTLSVIPDEHYIFSGWAVSSGEDLVYVEDNQFTMPDADVTVSAVFTQAHSITISTEIQNGTVTADKNVAVAGEEVTLTATPADHYTFGGWEITGVSEVNNDKFLMPDQDVTVLAYFDEIKSKVTISASAGGTLTVSQGETPIASGKKIIGGTELTVIATPDAANHYIGGDIKVTKADGSDVTSEVLSGNTLIMPDYAITISASFVATYAINISAEGGTIELAYDKNGAEDGYALAGVNVIAEAQPDALHTFKSLAISDNALNVQLVGDMVDFTMPAEGVTITATFDLKKTPVLEVDPYQLNFRSEDQYSEPEGMTFRVYGVNLTGSKVYLALDSEMDDAFWISSTELTVVDGAVDANVLVKPKTDKAGSYLNRVTISTDDLPRQTVDLYLTVNPRYIAKWYVNGEMVQEQIAAENADMLSFPSDFSTFTDCSDLKFIGWITSELSAPQAEAPAGIITETEELLMPGSDVNYYAVFAELTNETTIKHKYSHEILSKTWGGDNGDTQTLSGVSWTLFNDGNYYGYSGEKGQQIGSGGSPAGAMRLSTTDIAGTIDSVTIYTSGAKDVAAEVSVAVNEIFYKCDEAPSKPITMDNTGYSFAGKQKGEILIMWAQSSAKALYFKQIDVVSSEVEYEYGNYVTTCPHCSAVELATYAEHGTVSLTYKGEEVNLVKTCNAVTIGVETVADDGYVLREIVINGVDGAVLNEAKTEVTIPANATDRLTVSAFFELIKYTVTTAQTGDAMSDLYGGKDDANFGDNVEIEATAVDGYVFLGWTASPEVVFADASLLKTTFPMPASDVTVTANFTKILTVAEAIALVDKDQAITHPNTYVSGIISNVESYDSKYKSMNYWIADDGQTKALQAYAGKGLNGADFTGMDNLHEGDKVIIKGELLYYNNTKYEMNLGNSLYQYEAKDATPLSIAVSGEPVLKKYGYGQVFDPKGLVVTATYNTGYKQVISEGIEWSTNQVDDKIIASGEIKVTAKVGTVTSAEYAVQVEISEQAPQFSLAEGTYTSAQTVILTAAEGAAIYYTLDGTDPEVKAELLYSDPISLSTRGKTVIKALAYSAKGESQIVSAEYNLNLPYTLAELVKAGLPSGTKDVIVEFESTIASFPNNRYGIYLNYKAGDNNIQIYYEGHKVPDSWAAGNAISGTVTGTWYCYTSGAKAATQTWEILPNSGFEWTDLIYTKPEPGLEWSAATGTGYVAGKADILPTLSNPNNVPVTYESTDESIATVSSSGFVSVQPKPGTTTIKAIFAGNEAYAAQTVSYELTVYDVAKLEVTGDATKKAYEAGDLFSCDGLGARATYTDNAVFDVDEGISWGTLPSIWENGTIQIKAAWSTYVSAPVNIAVTVITHEVSFAAPENGTLVVKRDGSAITSGDGLYRGDELTIEAEPNAGYKLVSLTANGADIKAAKAYTVGTEDVVIAATYAEKEDAGLAWTANKGTAYTVGKQTPLPSLSNVHRVAVTYESSNSAVAQIAPSTGNISIKGVGTTTIKASFAGDDDYKAGEASYELTVTAPQSVAISGSVNKTSYAINEDFSFDGLTLIVTYDNNDIWEAAKIQVEWTADPAKMAATTTKVSVTGKWNEMTTPALEVDVTVSDKPAAEISWSASTAKAYTIGQESPALPTLTNTASLAVSYDSSDPNVATIDADGKVTIKAAGQTYIKATFAGNDDYRKTEVGYTLTVYAPHAIVIGGSLITTEYAKDAVFDFKDLTASVTYGDATMYEVTDDAVWSTNLADDKVVEAGNVTITVTWNGLSTSMVVAVTIKEDPSAIDNAEVEMKATKIMINGIIYIQRGDKLFNAQGQVVH